MGGCEQYQCSLLYAVEPSTDVKAQKLVIKGPNVDLSTLDEWRKQMLKEGKRVRWGRKCSQINKKTKVGNYTKGKNKK